jgi:HEPN domain-containing protein
LKALLEERGHAIPKTHNLDDLFGLLHPHYAKLRPLHRGLIFLTDFAVGIRYPGDNASKRQAASARRWAERARTTCRTLLGIRPGKPRRRR